MDSINERDIDFIKGKKRVLGELLRIGKIEPGKLINYAEFLDFHSLYKYLTNEREFAEMLEISTDALHRMKNGGKARVLRSIQSELEKIREKQKTDPQGACIEMLKKYKELGFEKGQALRNTEEILRISPKEILKVMQDYQAKQKKVEVVANEGIAFGE